MVYQHCCCKEKWRLSLYTTTELFPGYNIKWNRWIKLYILPLYKEGLWKHMPLFKTNFKELYTKKNFPWKSQKRGWTGNRSQIYLNILFSLHLTLNHINSSYNYEETLNFKNPYKIENQTYNPVYSSD